MREIDHAYQTAKFKSLIASGNPRDWAIAALVPVFQDAISEEECAAQINRAVAAAPDDVLVQWIALSRQKATRNSLIDDAPLQTLRRLEPDNGAVWMEVLMRASQRKDDSAIDAALTQMAASTRNNEHISDLIKAQLDVYRRYPWPDEYFIVASEKEPSLSKEEAPYVYTMAVTVAFALPAYQDLINACRISPKTGENASRAATCASIGRLMTTHGTPVIANRIGAAVLRLSSTFKDDDVQLARTQDWIWQQKIALFDSDRPAEEIVAKMVVNMNDWIDTGSELEAARREIVRAGKSPTPPADWVDTQSPFSAERLRNDQLAAARAAAQAH